MRPDPVVIVGAGLTGLAAGRELWQAGEEVLLLEAEDRPGGLCRTEEVEGFSFDYSGHLLHLREGEVKDRLLGMLPGELMEMSRRAAVYLEGKLLPYPVQANFGRLSPPTVRRCIEGYRRAAAAGEAELDSFPAWVRGTFGDGLAELFMLPYNAKLFVHPLEEMEPSWTSWSVPRPPAREMERAARGEDTGRYGYNVTFFYPRRGGIERLPRALASGMEGCILTRRKVVEVDAAARRVTTAAGERFPYRHLISTAPLPRLLAMMRGAGPSPAAAARRLRHSSVACLCLGVEGESPLSRQWVYFPQPRLPFYRVGVFTEISPGLAPDGCHSLYVEVAHHPGRPPHPERLLEEVLAGLREVGVLAPGVRPRVSSCLSIPCAYVFHDDYRRDNLPSILACLEKEGITSVGRYGAWEYSGMEAAVAGGVGAARRVLS